MISPFLNLFNIIYVTLRGVRTRNYDVVYLTRVELSVGLVDYSVVIDGGGVKLFFH
ncbi:hypothetical protein SAMN04489717_4743 [Actinopolymorpha singaporensis]|uniref:Uncharacterized protein n=1 Tax=Actinopolymorpha singaporensis TaxID=117157 RepID=A0A1H1WZ85_9ACTN|nr:hypothetical protein SAMN04489717_4743 [Actinopolymorpha singaporensis]